MLAAGKGTLYHLPVCMYVIVSATCMASRSAQKGRVRCMSVSNGVRCIYALEYCPTITNSAHVTVLTGTPPRPVR